ncbi:spectrin beta chain, non-erythrocytic 1 [Trichonephila clavipes]|nr:spectrin beta chain, non-erythrocytic 1 [Trichonephila clavipes]
MKQKILSVPGPWQKALNISDLDNQINIISCLQPKEVGLYVRKTRKINVLNVDTDNPDEKSIIIYVSTFSKGLANVKKGMTGGKRITNILLKMMEIDAMKVEYNKEALQLLDWINSKVAHFKSMETLTSLEDIQQEIHKFKDYRTKEKPLKNDQKNEIEALLFAIQMKRFGQAGWIPPDETSPAEIEKAWGNLERSEHEHETQVRNQLIEQERLENLAYKLESKKSVRENYLTEMLKILTDPNYGTNIRQTDATFKKHEAIRTGIVAREAFVKDLFKVADTLIDANYRKKDEIIRWRVLLGRNKGEMVAIEASVHFTDHVDQCALYAVQRNFVEQCMPQKMSPAWAGINEKGFCIASPLVMTNRSTTITKRKRNHGNHVVMLQQPNIHGKKFMLYSWKNEMVLNWDYILRLLEAFDEKFSHLRQIMNILEEMDSILEEIIQMQEEFEDESEPLDIETGLQNQAVKEVQVTSWGEAIRRLEAKIESQSETKDTAVLQNQLSKLRQAHQTLVDASSVRREALEEFLKRKQLLENVEEMMAWIQEKKLYCDSDTNCKDLSGALYLQKKHKSLGSDLQIRKEMSEDLNDQRLRKAFSSLEDAWQKKEREIAFAVEAYQYLADAEECDSWISEKLHLLSSLDCGSDELTCEAFLRRHVTVQTEISTNASEVQRLRQEADRICCAASKKKVIFVRHGSKQL